MLDKLNAYLEGRTSFTVTLTSLFLILVIAAADHATGYEVSFSIFYTMPIAFASWYGGMHQGRFLSIVSAIVWLIADWAAGHQYSQILIQFWNAGVRFGFFIMIAMLIGTVKTQLEKEQRMARSDGLTGLMNLKAFEDAAQTIFSLATRYERSTVIGYIDLDNFKSVNDTLGHAEGDNVLRTVASILLKSVRSSDFVARLGGDEFALLLPETTYSGAATMFESLRRNLMKEAGEHGWPIGCSIGVAVFRAAPSNVEEAIKHADTLMYRVKNGGKNNMLMEEF